MASTSNLTDGGNRPPPKRFDGNIPLEFYDLDKVLFRVAIGLGGMECPWCWNIVDIGAAHDGHRYYHEDQMRGLLSLHLDEVCQSGPERVHPDTDLHRCRTCEGLFLITGWRKHRGYHERESVDAQAIAGLAASVDALNTDMRQRRQRDAVKYLFTRCPRCPGVPILPEEHEDHEDWHARQDECEHGPPDPEGHLNRIVT